MPLSLYWEKLESLISWLQFRYVSMSSRPMGGCMCVVVICCCCVKTIHLHLFAWVELILYVSVCEEFQQSLLKSLILQRLVYREPFPPVLKMSFHACSPWTSGQTSFLKNLFKSVLCTFLNALWHPTTSLAKRAWAVKCKHGLQNGHFGGGES